MTDLSIELLHFVTSGTWKNMTDAELGRKYREIMKVPKDSKRKPEDLEQYDKPALCEIIRYLEKRLGV